MSNIIYPNVSISKDCRIDEGVTLGFSETKLSQKTIIGKNSVLRAHTVIYAGVKIGENFQTGPNVLIRENNTIGKGVVVWHGTTLNPDNFIDDECRIHAGCFLEKTTLGKNVFLGPNVVFTDDPHPKSPPLRTCMKGAVLEEGVVIGGNVTILPHVHIGKHAVVGAGSVVTRDIPPFEIWVGSPARFLKKIEDLHCEIGDKSHYPYKQFLKLK